MSTNNKVTDSSRRILERVGDVNVTLYNAGDTTVYVDTVNPASTASQPINPQAQLVWTSKEVWAICAPGESGAIIIIENDGSLFDPASIAASIKISGAPPVDVPNVIVNDTTVAVGQSYGPLDTSAYQSVQMMTTGASTTEITLTWQDAGITVYKESFSQRGGGNAYYRTPCKGATLTISADQAGVSILAVESYRSVDTNDYTSETLGPIPAGATFIGSIRDGLSILENVPVAHGATVTVPVYSTNGDAFLRVGNVGAGGTINGAVTDSASGVAIASVQGVGSGSTGEDQTVLPCRPIRLRLTGDAAVDTTANIILTYRT